MDLNLGQGASTGGLSYKGLQLYHNYKTDATDKSPKNSNHGVMYTGRSLAFDGSNDYVDFGTNVLSDFTGGYTIVTFLKLDSIPTDTNVGGVIFQNYSSPAGMFFSVKSSGKLHSRHHGSGATQLDSNEVLETDTWYRVVKTNDGTTSKIYINGIKDDNDVSDVGVWDSTNNATLGSWNTTAFYLDGELSNVQIWDKAWTADDVAYDYANAQATPNDIANNNSALSVANCRTWLPMTEGEGFTIYDGGVVLGDETVTNTAITDWDLSVIAPELVTNGTFDASISGWFSYNNSWDSTNKRMNTLYTYYQDIAVTAGASYAFSADVTIGIAGSLRVGTPSDIGAYAHFTSNGTHTVAFIPTESTVQISGFGWSAGTLDNVTLKETNPATNSTYDTGTLSIGASNTISQDDVYEGTREYLTELDVSAYTGTVEVQDGAGTTLHTVSATGEQSFLTTGNGSTDNLQIVASASSSATVDSISVKEVQPKENGGITPADATGATWQTGVIGSEVETPFDGSADIVELGTADEFLDANTTTLSAWIKSSDDGTGSSQYAPFIGTRYGKNFQIGRNSGQSSAGVLINLSTNGNINSPNGTTDVFDEKWHHVVGTFDNGTIMIYVDGVLEGTNSTYTDTIGVSSTFSFGIGGSYHSSDSINDRFFDGQIKQASIFDHALTSTEVSELYALGKGGDVTGHSKSDTNLVGYWKNTGVQKWDDLSGNDNHGTFKNHVFGNIPQTGLMSYNKPMLFDGTDDRVVPFDTTKPITITGTATYSAWFITNSTSTEQVLLYGANGQDGFSIGIGNLGLNDGIGTRLRTNGGTTSRVGGSNQLQAGVLHNVAMVIDWENDTSSLYLDGVLGTTSDNTRWTNGNGLVIGTRAGTAYPFDGILNEVSIFDTALTADEISELYNNGTPLSALEHSKVDNLQGYWRNDGDDVWVDRTPVLGAELGANNTFVATARLLSHDYDDGDLVFTMINDDVTSPDEGYVQINLRSSALVTDKKYKVSIQASEAFTPTTSYDTRLVLNGTDNDFSDQGGTSVRTLDFDNVSSLTSIILTLYAGGSVPLTYTISIKEVKGGNDGTVSGSPESILLPEARNGRDTLGFPINNVNNGYLALHGDGYVEVADDASLDFSDSFSIECWVKPSELADKQMMSSYLSDAKRWYFRTKTTGSLHYYSKETDTDTLNLTSASYNVNEWVHAVLVSDEDTSETLMYVNGVFAQKVGITQPLTWVANIEIGSMSVWGIYTDGSIDEPRIYNRALTEAEVLQNYNAGKSKHRN